MAAVPPYTAKHAGPVLVCGPAPSLFADFGRARKAYPDAELMALSWAIRAVRAAHCFSLHYEKAQVFRALGAADHPGHSFLIHSQPPRKESLNDFPHVDHFWPEAWDCQNTAVAAARVALSMGFFPVILCGVALDGSEGYAFDVPTPCFWNKAQAAHAGELVRGEFARNRRAFAWRVFGMSGAPKDMFGLPPAIVRGAA